MPIGLGARRLQNDSEPSREEPRCSLNALAAAHARLRTVAHEEDDDALVRDIQQILGTGRLDKLPMILKLIFVEEQEAQAADGIAIGD